MYRTNKAVEAYFEMSIQFGIEEYQAQNFAYLNGNYIMLLIEDKIYQKRINA